MYLDKNAIVKRLSPTANDNNQEAYSTIFPNVKINIQPASAELTAVADGVYGQTYLAFVSVSGIEIGDQITISGTNQNLIVKGVNDWNFSPLAHLELILFKADL